MSGNHEGFLGPSDGIWCGSLLYETIMDHLVIPETVGEDDDMVWPPGYTQLFHAPHMPPGMMLRIENGEVVDCKDGLVELQRKEGD